MRTSLARSIRLACLALALPAVGCGVPGEEYAKVQRELLTTQAQVRKLEEQLAAKEQTIRIMKNQLVNLRGMKPENLEQLIVPVRIELERQSGGYDTDGKAGDDGIVLYVQPIDRSGDVIKAAGSLKVTLLDLANPTDQYVIGEYVFDVNKTRELWYGRMWTYHFIARCPWYPGKSPAHSEITARVEFQDLLTGLTLTAQGAYKTQLPPEQGTGSGESSAAPP